MFFVPSTFSLRPPQVREHVHVRVRDGDIDQGRRHNEPDVRTGEQRDPRHWTCEGPIAVLGRRPGQPRPAHGFDEVPAEGLRPVIG